MDFIKELLRAILGTIEKSEQKRGEVDNKIVTLVSEIDELQVKLADKLGDAERWGDLEDSSHWRTVEVNKLIRKIDSKKELLKTLKS